MKMLSNNRRRPSPWAHILPSLPVTAAFLLGLGLAPDSRAQQSGFVAVPPDLPNLVGVGLGVAPDYEGSDDLTFGVLPAGQDILECVQTPEAGRSPLNIDIIPRFPESLIPWAP